MKKGRSSRQLGVYQRGDTWYVRYWFQGRDVRRAVGPSYDEAVRALHKVKADIEAGKLEGKFGIGTKKNTTFRELAEWYVRENPANKRPSSRKRDESSLKVLLPCFGPLPLNDITAWHVEKYKRQRSQSKQRRHPDNRVSTRTVNMELALLKTMFNHAIRMGWTAKNPVKGVKLFPEKRSRTNYLTPHECRALIDAATPHTRPVILALLHTGARVGEILSLDWQNVDMRHRQIILTNGKTVATEPEYIPIDDTLYQTLKEIGVKDMGPVFLNQHGEPLKDIRTQFRRALRVSGIEEQRRKQGKPKIWIHDMRHTAASLLVMEGRPIQDVQRLLRHRNISTTMRYTHLSPDHMKNVAQTLDSVLSLGTKSGTSTEMVQLAIAKNPL